MRLVSKPEELCFKDRELLLVQIVKSYAHFKVLFYCLHVFVCAYTCKWVHRYACACLCRPGVDASYLPVTPYLFLYITSYWPWNPLTWLCWRGSKPWHIPISALPGYKHILLLLDQLQIQSSPHAFTASKSGKTYKRVHRKTKLPLLSLILSETYPQATLISQEPRCTNRWLLYAQTKMFSSHTDYLINNLWS